MMNLLPAVLIGGSPHAGKSVLFYSLTQALRERNIRHHAIRACPDGEGNWSQESDQHLVEQIHAKGEWSPPFVARLSEDLEHRCLPLLVDVGGRPKPSEACLFSLCTHAILLLKIHQPDDAQLWDQIVEENDLRLLARINSQLDGTSTITVQSPYIEGIITNLIRGKDVRAKGPVFDALVESVATLFNSSSPHQLEQVIFQQAPSELLNLYEIVPANERWEPEMLPSFLAGLPTDTPFSVYGVAPNWVYAALAVHIGSAPMHQCDPRLGWTQPLGLSLSVEQHPEVFAREHICQDTTVLSIKIPSKHLAYFQPNPLPFPPVCSDFGLIIDGIIPYWLLTALVRLYKDAGIAWIATYYPQLEKAVVVYSRIATHALGGLVSMPA